MLMTCEVQVTWKLSKKYTFRARNPEGWWFEPIREYYLCSSPLLVLPFCHH